MAKQKGNHNSDKEQYAAYKAMSKRSVNRRAALARHMKKHPNDEVALTASKQDGEQRSKPNVKGNFPAKSDYVYHAGTGAKIAFGPLTPKPYKVA